MKDFGIAVHSDLDIRADPTRVLSRLFIPGQELVGGSESRTSTTVERVLALSEADVEATLEELVERFSARHENLTDVFETHADRVADYISSPMSANRRQLLGAVFTSEYSVEGAAVCNPSLVAHPDQTNLAENSLRVVLSYRSIGEGHHSAISFRTGEIRGGGAMTLDAPERFPVVASISDGRLNRDLFHASLHDLGVDGETASSVLNNLAPFFSPEELDRAIARLTSQGETRVNVLETAYLLRLIAASFYVATFESSTDLSRRVLWPSTPKEAQGMEDARFVHFHDGDDSRYVASYTAFDGQTVSQQLLETTDFETFASSPLAGRAAKNKGLAIFPRRVGGRFAALSRHDRESNSIAFSSDMHHWDEVSTTQTPLHPWEILQLGNCGSPIELAEGWLVITHGVGPMRTYGIGALLLDLEDPTKVIGQLRQPLLVPEDDQRDGYVPNVVYSCGSLVYEDVLYLPYGVADQSISYASVAVPELLAALDSEA